MKVKKPRPTMKVKKKSKEAIYKTDKVARSKSMKEKGKQKPFKHDTDNIPGNNESDRKKKKKTEEKVAENASECTKKEKHRPNPTDQPSKSTNDQAPKSKHKPIKKKKKAFNKDAIEKMKARQLAKKEKLMRQNSPATPQKPEAKRRRPKLPVRLESVELKFSEDDDTMAQFDGTWVPREEMGRLQSAREDLEKRGLPAEKVGRRMKQLVRKEHRKLKIRLIAAQTKTERVARERRLFLEAQQTPRMRKRAPGRACGLTLQENEQLARFDGFWVAAEAIPRLEALRQKLLGEGKSENEARRLLRKARRVEERKVKSSGRLFCTKCSGRGHLLSDCTARAVEATAGTACFRCGDAGHRLSDCPKKGAISGLPFATCFLCKQQGHMSRECPRAEADSGQKPGKRSGGGAGGGGQSWRGETHDTEMATEPSVQKTPPPPPPTIISKQKTPVHIRFD